MNTILIILGVFIIALAVIIYPNEFNVIAWLGRKRGECLARKREKEIDRRLAEIDLQEKKLACEMAFIDCEIPEHKRAEFMKGCMKELGVKEEKEPTTTAQKVKKIVFYSFLVAIGGFIALTLFQNRRKI